MADIQIADRSTKRAAPKRVRADQNTATIMDRGNLEDCLAYIDEFISSMSKKFAQESGHPDGTFPASYRRVKREVNEVGMPISHLVNKGTSHRDYVRNMLRAVFEIQNQVQFKEFNGRWKAEKVEFWRSVRVVNHDATPSGTSEDARLAIAGLSSLGALTVEQVNLTDAGMTTNTPESRPRSDYEMEVIGITVTFVDTLNAADVRREKGEVVSSTDMARDQGLANSAAALAGAVQQLAAITVPAAQPEEKVHHKTAEKLQRLEESAAAAAREKQKALEEKDALAAKIAALEAQLASLTKK